MPGSANKSMPQVVNELWAMTKDYARQETLDPLKGVGRYIIFGFGGAVFGSIGVGLLLLSLLRALQTHTDLTGNLSWLPYLIVLAVGSVVIAVALALMKKK